jgi:hypothetical protein
VADNDKINILRKKIEKIFKKEGIFTSDVEY